MKNRLKFSTIALPVLATMLGFAATANASIITDVFTGVVVAHDSFADVTTKDSGKLFSNSAATTLVGDTFRLSFTYNSEGATYPGNIDGCSSNCSSSPYPSYPGDPFTAVSLTVDSLPKTFTTLGNNGYVGITNGDPAGYGWGPVYGGVNFQAFTEPNQVITENLIVNLDQILNTTLNLGSVLPGMSSANGDFNSADNYSFLSIGSETVVFDVTKVNGGSAPSAPEPSSLALLGTGILALGLLVYRKALNQVV